MSKDRSRVLVVDDDLGTLRAVKRLLRQHDYEPILFSSAQAFKNHADFEKAVCVILDINLDDGSGIELRHRLKADGLSVPVIYVTGRDDPAVREAALGFWMRRVSSKAILSAGADRPAQESIGRAFIDFVAVRCCHYHRQHHRDRRRQQRQHHTTDTARRSLRRSFSVPLTER